MTKFFSSNETIWRLCRTIAQAVLGVLIANVDKLISVIEISEVWKPVIVALVMAILSPIMAEIGKAQERKLEATKAEEKAEEKEEAEKGE